jgi:hypothetical protein
MEVLSIRQLGVGAACNTAPTPLTGSPQQVYGGKGCPGIKPEVKRRFPRFSVYVAVVMPEFVG